MTYKMKDAKITHLSLVDKGANGVPFAIIKAPGKNAIQKQVQIAKVDDTQHIVIGVVYQPDVEDVHGDMMDAVEIEKAAHLFMENQHTYNIDKQHDLDPDKGYVVESYIAPCDMEIGDQVIAKGSWVAGVKVTNDDTWEEIQKGDITGFSMFGVGKREEVEDETVSKGLMQTIKKAINAAVAPIVKGVVADKYNKNRKKREFWAAQDALNDVLFRWDSWESGMETDPEVIREALQDFVEIAQDVLVQEDIVKAIGKPPEAIVKAGKKISASNLQHIDDAIATLTDLKNKTAPADDQEPEEEDELKPEDIEKAVQAAVGPIVKQMEVLAADVTELKKQDGEGDPDPNAGTPNAGTGANPEADAVTDAIAKALAPLTEQMTTLAADVQIVKNSRGGSAQGGAQDENIHKADGSVSFSGLL
ncbi:XkdF-like putative serine protease domain-containing protein [Paenibacillus sp. 276b]|uniref:XkdF-like putative serine protease domain-containing protein n=1 Tax=Paenibacillus sp. 276b TaxID=1566277 RepID=UPI000899CBDB|nr:XkdF-like putative serine protease domain-containing protein [Paenibacillus sp. 276b]SEB28025.1 Putative phage serine protease XkdF [Paenibacillus sp. 276b]